MLRRELCSIILCLAFATQGLSHPLDFLRPICFLSKTDRTWLWGWAWGAESTVSIVDRSPALSFPSRPASFGLELNDPLLGYVIPLSSFTEPCSNDTVHTQAHPKPNLGCPTLCVTGPHEPERTESWIALVQRGSCQFVDKVREAQRLGAKAVVVGGDDPEVSGNPDTLVNMYNPDDSSDVTIAATFIKFSDYIELSSLISTSNTSHSGLRTLSLLITTEYSAWEWYSPIITFFIILVLPSLLTFATLLIHRVRTARAAQLERAPEDIVKGLPWRIHTGTGWEKHEGAVPDPDIDPAHFDVDLERGMPDVEVGEIIPDTPNVNEASTSQLLDNVPWFETQQECAICLSQFVKGDRVRELPCQHIFHLDEVDEWLIHRRKVCPICKADVTRPWLSKPPPVETHIDATMDVTEHDTETTTPPRSTLRSVSPCANERTPLLQQNSDNINTGP